MQPIRKKSPPTLKSSGRAAKPVQAPKLRPSTLNGPLRGSSNEQGREPGGNYTGVSIGRVVKKEAAGPGGSHWEVESPPPRVPVCT